MSRKQAYFCETDVENIIDNIEETDTKDSSFAKTTHNLPT